MVKHVILWTIHEKYSAAEKAEIIGNIKTQLEALQGKIPGMLSIAVYTDRLDSSNVDLMLDSSFENEDALQGYIQHPLHVAAADTYVRPYTETRNCLDFTV